MEHGNESLGPGWSTSRPFVETSSCAWFWWVRFVPRSGLHPVPPVRSSSYFCFRPADPGRGLARFTPTTPGRGAAHSAFRLRHCRATRRSSLSRPRVPPLLPPHPLVEPVETRVPPLLPPHPLVELVETRVRLCCRPTRRFSLYKPCITPSCQLVETVAWVDRLHQRWSYRINQRWTTTRPREECACQRVAGARPWFARRSAGSWRRRPSGVPRVGAGVRRCQLRPPRPG